VCGRWQPLHRAASSDAECTRLLLRKGASTETRDIDDSTPLHHTAQASHLRAGEATKIIGLLVDEGKIAVDSHDCLQATPLHLAAYKGNVRVNTLPCVRACATQRTFQLIESIRRWKH
jgi:ankyrin repeat protein